MSRSTDMSVLDVLEGILAQYVYHFDEDTIRRLSEQTNVKSGRNEIDWQKKRIKDRILTDINSMLPYVDLEESHPHAHLKHIYIEDLDNDSLLIKPDNFSIKCFNARTYGKSCDYVLFTKFNGKRYAIFIEMKTLVLENQDNGDLFVYNEDFEKGIVWQLIGADALIDGILDLIYKRCNQNYKSIVSCKKGSGKSDLAGFARRYLVLYEDVDRSGNVQMLQYAEPNVFALEKPIHVLKVTNSEHIKIGSLFSRSGLEK